MIAYDLIPYTLERDYLISYSTARLHGQSRRSALRHQLARYAYVKKLKINSKRSDKLLAISNHTKQDFVSYLEVPKTKISVVHLGINPKQNFDIAPPGYERYIRTSWGYMSKEYRLDPDIPYLLYVGGADPRRKLEHLVTAFNHLRAQGENIKLILVGDIMQGPDNIPTLVIQKALKDSSYLDDIVFMGFVSDEVRESLYEKALAFVYPSVYEGFGLPILEAMQYGTPVITYENTSIPEVAGKAAFYAQDYKNMVEIIEKLLNDNVLRTKYAKMGIKQAANFPWSKSTKQILRQLVE